MRSLRTRRGGLVGAVLRAAARSGAPTAPNLQSLLARVDEIAEDLAETPGADNARLDETLLAITALPTDDRQRGWLYLILRVRAARADALQREWAGGRAQLGLDRPDRELVAHKGVVHMLAAAWSDEQRRLVLLCGRSVRRGRLDRGTWDENLGCAACASAWARQEPRPELPDTDAFAARFDAHLLGFCSRWPWAEHHAFYERGRAERDVTLARLDAELPDSELDRTGWYMKRGQAIRKLTDLRLPAEQVNDHTWLVALPRASASFCAAVEEAAIRAAADLLDDELRARGDTPLLAAGLTDIAPAHRALRDLPAGHYRLVDRARPDMLYTPRPQRRRVTDKPRMRSARLVLAELVREATAERARDRAAERAIERESRRAVDVARRAGARSRFLSGV